MAASESAQLSDTASPRRSTALTPGSRASASASASGRVARIVREPTIALISLVGPSATIVPWAISTARSAYASASSR
jgi:hypothetical protein